MRRPACQCRSVSGGARHALEMGIHIGLFQLGWAEASRPGRPGVVRALGLPARRSTRLLCSSAFARALQHTQLEAGGSSSLQSSER